MSNPEPRTEMISELIDSLRELDDPPTWLEIAEGLWLAESMSATKTARRAVTASHGPTVKAGSAAPPRSVITPLELGAQARSPTGPGLDPKLFFRTAGPGGFESGRVPISVPTVPALTGTGAIFRALRPLNRRFPSATKSELDEEETAARTADFGLWSPRFRPTMDRWLDLTLVVDTSASMALWRQSVLEFRTVLDRLGAFRDVRTWRFDGDRDTAELNLSGESDLSSHRSSVLADPSVRHVILLV